MEAVELAIPAAVTVPKLMGSEVLVGARVCSTDGKARESNTISTFSGHRNDDYNTLLSLRGTSSALGSSSWIKKTDTELCTSNGLQGIDNGTTNGSTALISGSEGKRKVGKVPRNSSGSFKKPRMLQIDTLLPQAEADDTTMEPDKLGLHLMRCSSADKSQAVKQKNNINGRRGDKRNSKVLMKAKYDPFSPKGGFPSFSPASGGGNIFGMYGLKPDINDVTKLINDISLDELLDGSYNCSTLGKDKGKKAANNVDVNILDSVRKACSILQLRVSQQHKNTEEVDIHVDKNIPLLPSPSNISASNCSDGDENILAPGLPKCIEEESCIKSEAPNDMKDDHLFQPRDILERLALPPHKDLESLLQDASKPAVSMKLTDLRSNKPLSHRVSLPPFPWSHNFNGHYKSNNDAIKISNKSTCQGRWVRIRSTASFIGGGGVEGFNDVDSLTYDDSLVPAGKVKYRLPEIERNSSTQQDLSSSVCPETSIERPAVDSPGVLAAAQTLCDIASHYSKINSNGILKLPKQPSQKAVKPRNSRSSEKPEKEFLTPKSETILDHHVVRSVEYGSSSKKAKLSREEFSHIHTVIGLTSVSAPRSSRLSRDLVAEARHSNGSFRKPSFMVPSAPTKVLERGNPNPQKLRKVGPMDWNRTRS